MRWKFAVTVLIALVASSAVRAQQWTTPTPEELKMTSIPDVPGAEAVILNHEETDDDDLHVQYRYFRIKVLSEHGLKYANLEIDYNRRTDSSGYAIGEFSARTIQPDGTVIPFLGKGMDRILEKDAENAYTRRTYTLPAAQVGSILEYRYTIRRGDDWYASPQWFLQGDLYVKNERFLWKPTDKELTGSSRGGREHNTRRLTWSAVLPRGVTVSNTKLATGRIRLEVAASNIMPFAREQYMPPISSSRFHVFFYYTPYQNPQDYWDTEIKYWNADTNKFTANNTLVASVAHDAIAGASTNDEKARKLYAFVMTLENTDDSRERTTQEEKKQIRTAQDVLQRRHGSASQIAMTYVALARAVGLKADAVYVSDRSSLMLDATWQDISQLTDTVAVVNYDGKDHYLDPGNRRMPYGHLEWNHSLVGGVRQDNKDKVNPFLLTPGEPYTFSRTSRLADLKLEEDGHVTGALTFLYDGSPALRWRHVALKNDNAELTERLKKHIESLLPEGSEVKITSISNIDNGELPLKVQASVSSRIGSSAGSRVLLPSVLFENNSTVTFPHEKRERGVYFPYTEMTQDAVRYTLPTGWTVQSAPAKEVVQLTKRAAYSLTSQQTAASITLHRDLVIADIYFPQEQYQEVRSFYNDFEAKDHSNIVIQRNTTAGQQAH